jgi:hypothetical protein
MDKDYIADKKVDIRGPRLQNRKNVNQCKLSKFREKVISICPRMYVRFENNGHALNPRRAMNPVMYQK